MDVSWSEAQRAETNAIARGDDIATDAIAARVGAMDVSWSEAQRAETNVIARSDDHAATTITGYKVHTVVAKRKGIRYIFFSYNNLIYNKIRYTYSLMSFDEYVYLFIFCIKSLS
jgi:hypothetical protein